jgi:tRNA pseudouridine38-40 synthase
MVNQNPRLRNIELSVAYAGQNFFGSQIQPDCRTVQGEIQAALRELLGRPELKIQAASRTDAGVHAHDQRFGFQVDHGIPVENLVRALNHRLAKDVRVLQGRERPQELHVRHGSKAKHYTYFICIGQPMPPAFANYVWEVSSDLDVAAMTRAAQYLIGTRCFRALQSRKDFREQTVTTLHEVRISQKDALLAIDVIGRSFLYNMVRNIVGSLVPVGRGEWTPDSILDRLESGERELMGMTAPASGLHLFDVHYSEPPWPPSKRRDHFFNALAEASKITALSWNEG